MASPAYGDLIYYTATPLDDSDWQFNFHKVVDYLTDGTWDVTTNSLTTTADATVGGDLAVAGSSTVGGDLTVTGTVTIAGATVTGIESLQLADNFNASPDNVTYVPRTGGTLSITIASSAILLHVSSVWTITGNNDYAFFRINVDSGSQYIALGSLPLTGQAFIGGTFLLTGLSAGAHTFIIEVRRGGGNTITAYNNCSGANCAGSYSLVAQEI